MGRAPERVTTVGVVPMLSGVNCSTAVVSYGRAMAAASVTASARPPRPGGWPLTLGLVALILGWLTTPVVFLYLSTRIGPESGHDPTLSQLHQGGFLVLSFMIFGELVPLVGLVIAWFTRRRVLAVTVTILLIAVNVGLGLVGAPPWDVLAQAIKDITADSVPWTTP